MRCARASREDGLCRCARASREGGLCRCARASREGGLWRVPPTLSRGGTSFDEKGMEVAPRPVSKDDLPFRPRSSDGRSWIQPAAPGYDPRAEIHIEARPFVSRRRHSLHPHVTCGRQVPRPKRNDQAAKTQGPREGCGPAVAAWRIKARPHQDVHPCGHPQDGGCFEKTTLFSVLTATPPQMEVKVAFDRWKEDVHV